MGTTCRSYLTIIFCLLAVTLPGQNQRVNTLTVTTGLTNNGVFKQANGANDGYVFTSDNAGVARWRLPGATINYYVDQAAGSDSNTGLSSGSAFQTIAKLTNTIGALPNNVTINLARGSLFREQLTVGTNNTVKVYGSGPRPILNASDIATNSNWIKLGGFANVWMYTNWTVTGGGAPSYLSVAENGVQLIRSNDLAGVDLVAGTFLAIDDPPVGSATNVIFIHPRGSTIPTNDFKLYEIAKRNYGFFCSDNNTVEDLHTTGPHFSNNGSFEAKKNNLIKRCIFENGTKHNVLFGSGVIEDCVAWKQEYNQQSAALFVNFDTSDDLSIIYRRCLAKGDPDLVASATGFFGHSAGHGYAFVLHEDCAAEFAQGYGTSGCSTNGLSIFNRCRARGLTLSGWSAFGGTNIFLEPSLIYTPAVPANPSFVGISIGGDSSKNYIAGALISGIPFAVSVIVNTTDAITEIQQSYLSGDGAAIQVGGGSGISNCTFVISNSILQGYGAAYNIATNNTITAANSNVISFGSGLVVNGVTYGTWGAYLAAFPTLDTGTKTNELQSVGNAFNGDFNYAPTSPAVTNQAGPGWTIVRRPISGDSRLGDTISDTPTRQVGGDDLLGLIRNGTNVLHDIKLNRTNDTAFQFKISGTWTNVAAATAQFNSVGNGVIRLNKAGAGNVGEIIHSAGGTDLSRFATDSAGTTIIETLNNSPMYIFINNLLRIFGSPLHLYGSSSALGVLVSGNDVFFADTVTITNTLTCLNTASIPTNTANYTLDITDLVINTWYTNDSRRSVVSLSFELDSNTTGTAKAGIYVDQAKDGTFETTKTVQALGLADPQQLEATAWLQPGARFAITNLSSGAGSPTVAVVAGSCQWVKQ